MEWEEIGKVIRPKSEPNPILGCIVLFIILAVIGGACG